MELTPKKVAGRSKTRRTKRLWICGIAVMLTLLGWLWWTARWPSYEESNVHPKLRGLTHPFQAFHVGYITDGGSIALSGKDREGREFQAIIPNRMSANENYDFICAEGTDSDMKSGAVPLERLNPDTRYMLARFIRDYWHLDQQYSRMKDAGEIPWRVRADCFPAQRLLKHKFPLCLDFSW